MVRTNTQSQATETTDPTPEDRQATETTSTPKAKDYEISKLQFGNLVCQQCGEQRRSDVSGVFCPVADPECPRYVNPDA